MNEFAVRVSRSDALIRIQTDHENLFALGQDLLRHRFIIGDLVEENGHKVMPAVRVLLPLHRIDLVADGEGDQA